MPNATEIPFFSRATPSRTAWLRWLVAGVFLLLGASNVVPALAQGAAPDQFEVTLPGAAPMVFQAVYLGIDGTRMFNSRRIRLGDRNGSPSYKLRLVETLLAGGFVGERNGRQDWLYYLGVTEVRRDQWAALMEPDGVGGWRKRSLGNPPAPLPVAEAALPQTAVTAAEVAAFVEALNTAMLADQRAALPAYKGARAFARLPTEAEWEFAARGGVVTLETDPARFDAAYPYSAEVRDHEWLKGSADNRVQAVGVLAANPVGLRDMLGNVQEYTLSLFGPEYQQGRFGDWSIRGHHYGSNESTASVADRTELLAFDDDGTLLRSERTGFRLTLASRVSSMQGTADDFDTAFAAYASGTGLPYPGLVGTTSPATQAAAESERLLDDLQAANERMRGEIRVLNARIEEAGGEASITGAADLAAREEASVRLREATAEAAKLAARLQGLETENARLAQEAAAALQQEQRLASDLARRNAELDELRAGLTLTPPGDAPKVRDERAAALQAENQRLLAEVRSIDMQRLSEARRRETLEADQRRMSEQLAQASQRANQLADERAALEARVKELLATRTSPTPGLATPATLLAERVAARDAEVAELQRQLVIREREVLRNADRVRFGERRLLEALLRQASANAYLAFRSLTEAEVMAVALQGLNPSPTRLERQRQRFDEGAQMVIDYWRLVEQIALDTDRTLFPEVKAEVGEWLRIREEPGKPGRQRKALDLIERHIGVIRGGYVLRPADLIETFLVQPEFQ